MEIFSHEAAVNHLIFTDSYQNPTNKVRNASDVLNMLDFSWSMQALNRLPFVLLFPSQTRMPPTCRAQRSQLGEGENSICWVPSLRRPATQTSYEKMNKTIGSLIMQSSK